MAKQQKEELPLMDDFAEESLLDQLVEEEEAGVDDAEELNEETDNDDDSENLESKLEEESEEDSEEEEDDEEEDEEEEDEKSVKNKSKKSSKEDSEEESTESFWSDVEKLTGRQIEVEYGDVDPETPEGAAIREEALAQQVVNDHLDYLSKIYPREFRALEHAANGGKLEDLYSPAEPDYSKISIGEDDEEAQKSFMNSYYQRKGFSPSKAKRMVEADEDSEEGLYSATKDALKELSTDQERERNRIIEDQRKADMAAKKQDMQMIGSVERVVQSGKLNKFTVPVKEREGFYEYALSNMQRNPNGGYMFVQPVQPNDLERQLQEMYFAYKGGDLSKIIQREVKTEGAKRLKRASSKESSKKIGSGSGSSSKKRSGLPTFKDHEA
jgi:hypothetical protein